MTYCKLAYSLNVLSHKVTKRFLLTSQVSWPHWFLFSIFSASILRNPQFFRGLSFLGIKCHSFIIRHTLTSSRQSSSILTMNSALSNLLVIPQPMKSCFSFIFVYSPAKVPGLKSSTYETSTGVSCCSF